MLDSDLALRSHLTVFGEVCEDNHEIMSLRFNPMTTAWSPAPLTLNQSRRAHLRLRSRSHDFQPFRSHAIGLIIMYIIGLISMYPTNTFHPEPDWPMCQCAMAQGPFWNYSLGGPCFHSEKNRNVLRLLTYIFHFFLLVLLATIWSTRKHAQISIAYDFLPPRLSNIWLKGL